MARAWAGLGWVGLGWVGLCRVGSARAAVVSRYRKVLPGGCRVRTNVPRADERIGRGGDADLDPSHRLLVPGGYSEADVSPGRHRPPADSGGSDVVTVRWAAVRPLGDAAGDSRHAKPGARRPAPKPATDAATTPHRRR